MTGLVRIILHWTAGGPKVSAIDRQHYHWIVPQDGDPEMGKWPVEANIKPVSGQYAAHTLNCNTGSIGLALCGMVGAVVHPLDVGRAPITEAQIEGACALAARLCAVHKIPVTRRTVLTHAEVQPTLGIIQRGKWDIRWLPGMKAVGDAVEVGDRLRARIKP
jgi:N-acetyl-anhydromuramyl-L-alanine amidase AmpD